MTKWEYFSSVLTWKSKHQWAGKINGEEVQGVDEFCNFYGQDGWELVNLTPALAGSLLAVFKRPLAESEGATLPNFEIVEGLLD